MIDTKEILERLSGSAANAPSMNAVINELLIANAKNAVDVANSTEAAVYAGRFAQFIEDYGAYFETPGYDTSKYVPPAVPFKWITVESPISTPGGDPNHPDRHPGAVMLLMAVQSTKEPLFAPFPLPKPPATNPVGTVRVTDRFSEANDGERFYGVLAGDTVAKNIKVQHPKTGEWMIKHPNFAGLGYYRVVPE